jgi:hypothetical protein
LTRKIENIGNKKFSEKQINKMEKKDHYAKLFMGTDYEIPKVKTIGELKGFLEEIVADLPENNELKISETHAVDNNLGYTLLDGIPN